MKIPLLIVRLWTVASVVGSTLLVLAVAAFAGVSVAALIAERDGAAAEERSFVETRTLTNDEARAAYQGFEDWRKSSLRSSLEGADAEKRRQLVREELAQVDRRKATNAAMQSAPAILAGIAAGVVAALLAAFGCLWAFRVGLWILTGQWRLKAALER